MNDIVRRDDLEAVDILTGAVSLKSINDYGTYSRILLFSNENLEGTAAELSYQNKSVLTVASSGDQYLAAMYYGAKNVDLFDINRFTYYLTCLKITAVKHLSYYEYLNFFIPPYTFEKNKYFFAVSTLERLIPFMEEDVAYFWEQVINCSDKSNIDINRLASIYDISCDVVGVKNGSPFYENKENYEKLKDRVISAPKPIFYETDIVDIQSLLKNSYDVVYLSNILFRLGLSSNSPSEISIFKEILSKLRGNLNDNCRIMVNYYFNNHKENVGFDYESIKKISFISKYLPYDDDFLDIDTDVALVYTYNAQK